VPPPCQVKTAGQWLAHFQMIVPAGDIDAARWRWPIPVNDAAAVAA